MPCSMGYSINVEWPVFNNASMVKSKTKIKSEKKNKSEYVSPVLAINKIKKPVALTDY